MKKQSRTPRASKPASKVVPNSSPRPYESFELTDAIRDRIAQKAYELFELRGREPGHEEEDWLKAEQIIRDDLFRASHVPS
jgi:hypothetical protein